MTRTIKNTGKQFILNSMKPIEIATEPHLILNRLREKIIEALGQKGTMSEVKDGMDGSIISFDPKTKSLIYSGAFNPMYLIRRDRIIEFKGDRMTLSFQDNNADFSHQEIKTRPDDLIYLSTDGYTDQFGGEEEKIQAGPIQRGSAKKPQVHLSGPEANAPGYL